MLFLSRSYLSSRGTARRRPLEGPAVLPSGREASQDNTQNHKTQEISRTRAPGGLGLEVPALQSGPLGMRSRCPLSRPLSSEARSWHPQRLLPPCSAAALRRHRLPRAIWTQPRGSWSLPGFPVRALARECGRATCEAPARAFRLCRVCRRDLSYYPFIPHRTDLPYYSCNEQNVRYLPPKDSSDV